jgi:hypothetical protein
MRQPEHVGDLVDQRPRRAAPCERLPAGRPRLTEERGIRRCEAPHADVGQLLRLLLRRVDAEQFDRQFGEPYYEDTA